MLSLGSFSYELLGWEIFLVKIRAKFIFLVMNSYQAPSGLQYTSMNIHWWQLLTRGLTLPPCSTHIPGIESGHGLPCAPVSSDPVGPVTLSLRVRTFQGSTGTLKTLKVGWVVMIDKCKCFAFNLSIWVNTLNSMERDLLWLSQLELSEKAMLFQCK